MWLQRLIFISSLPRQTGGVVGVVQDWKGIKNKDRAIFCETNYSKKFMDVVHGWMDSTIRFVEAKQCVAKNHQTS